MFRYLAYIWDPSDSTQHEAACELRSRIAAKLPEFRASLSQEGVVVLCTGIQADVFEATTLCNGAGIILGSTYRRSGGLDGDAPSPRATFGRRESDSIRASHGRVLTRDYWGDYVAIILDAPSPNTRVLKDPAGNLPCFCTLWHGITLVFSAFVDCRSLCIRAFTVNWGYVSSRMASGTIDHDYEPLNEISQIYRGECLTVTAGAQTVHSRELYWNPTAFTDSTEPIEDAEYAARILRSTTRYATFTLAQAHPNILLRLSGGLDSSIIASCLRAAPSAPRVHALTYYIPHGKSDERRWARLAANYTGFEHTEHAIEPANIRLERLLSVRPTVEPLPLIAHMERGIMERSHAQSHGCSAVFCGDGGDSSFCSESIGMSVDDYLFWHGLRLKALSLSAQVAVCRDTLAWGVFIGAMKRWLFGGRLDDFRGRLLRAATLSAPLVRANALRQGHYPHPWFRAASTIPWRSIFRVGNLAATPTLYNPFLDPSEWQPPLVSPLYSQPVLELCLRIPVYIHFLGGHDRGLARAAFADEIPDAIRRRRWKDRAPGSFEDITHHNRNFLRERLLGGVLSQRGLIDRAAVEKVLSGEAAKSDFFIGELYTFLDLELWLQHFASPASLRVAA